MMNKKLKKGLNIMLCAALLTATLTTTLGPPIISEAYTVGGMREVKPPNGSWNEELWNIIKTVPKDTKMRGLSDKDDVNREGFVIAMTAKSSNPANQRRYSSIAYEIQWKNYRVTVGAYEIEDHISNGQPATYIRYIPKSDVIKALVAQGQCSSIEQATEVANIMIREKGRDQKVFATTYFAFTNNGAVKPPTKRKYANGSITFTASGDILFKGIRLEEIFYGSRTDLLEEFREATAFGTSGASKAAQAGFSKTVQNDITRNSHRELGEPIIIGEEPEKNEEPVLPPNTRNTRDMITYHTWDNTERNRSKLSSYYVTYNDSRNYDDSEGHHDAFTNEDGNGLVIPSSESFVNGVERARKGCLDLCLDQ